MRIEPKIYNFILGDYYKHCPGLVGIFPHNAPQWLFSKNKANRDGLARQCKICCSIGEAARYNKNKPAILEQKKEYYTKNRCVLIEKAIETERKRSARDPLFRLTRNLRKRIRSVLLGCKSAASAELIGCSSEELKLYLEQYFKPGMNWDNYGTSWHVDHIIAISTFSNLLDPEQQQECFRFTNLQPLWGTENMSKHDKVASSPVPWIKQLS
jgi:hypothetical protein